MMAMVRYVLLLFALLALACFKHADARALVLTAGNATEAYAASEAGDIWLIEFFSPGCGHCRKFAESYDAVAAQLHADEGASVHVAKVDVSRGRDEKAWFRLYNLPGYPSFIRVEKAHGSDIRAEANTVHVFAGRRSAEALVDFARHAHDGTELSEWKTQKSAKSASKDNNIRAKIAVIAASVVAVGAVLLIAIKLVGPAPADIAAQTRKTQ